MPFQKGWGERTDQSESAGCLPTPSHIPLTWHSGTEVVTSVLSKAQQCTAGTTEIPVDQKNHWKLRFIENPWIKIDFNTFCEAFSMFKNYLYKIAQHILKDAWAVICTCVLGRRSPINAMQKETCKLPLKRWLNKNQIEIRFFSGNIWKAVIFFRYTAFYYNFFKLFMASGVVFKPSPWGVYFMRGGRRDSNPS
jgi:hypothetical protein